VFGWPEASKRRVEKMIKREQKQTREDAIEAYKECRRDVHAFLFEVLEPVTSYRGRTSQGVECSSALMAYELLEFIMQYIVGDLMSPPLG
jgi:hypothetical protein